MLPPTVREDLSDKPGLRCCCSTHRSWHTYTHKHTKPKNKPTQRDTQREKLNMLNSVNCKKGCEICVGDKSGMQHFERKAHFLFFLQQHSVSVRWYMLWLWTFEMLTNSYFFLDLSFFSSHFFSALPCNSCSIKMENTIILPFLKVHSLDFCFLLIFFLHIQALTKFLHAFFCIACLGLNSALDSSK